MTDARSKDRWDKAQIIAGALGAVAIPLAIALVGLAHASALKDAELRAKQFEAALAVLQEAPDPEKRALRAWAIDVFSASPLAEIRPDVRAELAKQRFPSVVGGNAVIGDAGAAGGFVSGRGVPASRPQQR